jgi:glycogen debranching enzyme
MEMKSTSAFPGLAPTDPQYRGRYTGGPVERDGAYHQGTVWPWLLGPFITAYVKVNGGSETARQQAAEWLEPLKVHLGDGGLGHISEIFDGDSPQRPCGCVAQAWSVAEILRAYVEDVKDVRQTVHVDDRPAQSDDRTAARELSTKVAG